MPRREIPLVYWSADWEDQARRHRPPTTFLEALMQTAPGDEPQATLEDSAELRHAVQDCVACLDGHDQELVHAAFWQNQPFRAIEQQTGLPKSTAHRHTQRALERLRSLLERNTVIRQHLGLPPYWEEACRNVVRHLERDSLINPSHADDLEAINTAIELWSGHSEMLVPDIDRATARLLGVAAVAAIRLLGGIDVDEVAGVLARKHHDYGTEAITRFGTFGVVVRCSDKLARWHQLNGADEPKCEALDDTLLDIIGYAVIAFMLSEGTFELDMAPTDVAHGGAEPACGRGPQVGIEVAA